MDKNLKVFIAGHKGLVGSSIVRALKARGFNNLITKSKSELNLLNQQEVATFFEVEKPDYVILAAAKVGGIMANNTYRADFIYENLQIQNNVIHSSWQHGVKKLLFLGSSCIYPKNAEQPMVEDCLLTDVLEYTNEPYAIAKIAGIKTCESYNLQYNTNFIAVMPTNLYGPNDNYNLETSHVLPALIRKMHLGKCLENNHWDKIKSDFDHRPVEGVNGSSGQDAILAMLKKYGISKELNGNTSITLWGSGSPYREFLHSDDMADACLFVMEKIDFADVAKSKNNNEIRNTHLNIGSGTDLTIKDLALLIKNIVGFNGSIIWDASKPDGTYRKLMNVDKLKTLGWQAKISLNAGLESVYKQYIL